MNLNALSPICFNMSMLTDSIFVQFHPSSDVVYCCNL